MLIKLIDVFALLSFFCQSAFLFYMDSFDSSLFWVRNLLEICLKVCYYGYGNLCDKEIHRIFHYGSSGSLSSGSSTCPLNPERKTTSRIATYNNDKNFIACFSSLSERQLIVFKIFHEIISFFVFSHSISCVWHSIKLF